LKNIDMEGRAGPPLGDVICELVDRLVSDDWCRYSTKDGSRHYYEIGLEAAEARRSGNADFRVLEFPAREPVSPLAEWYTRSQVAGKHPDYVQRARRRLESLGVPPAVIDGFEEGEFDFKGWHWNASATREQRIEALHFLYQALKIPPQEGTAAEMDDGGLNEVEVGRQKWYLNELARKFQRLVNEGSALDPLDFHDPQLEEASRCFLYGFYRATIVLSAAAVEKYLKEATGKKSGTYPALVDFALWSGKLGANEEFLAGPTKVLFEKRNDVVHNNWNPPEQEAGEILGVARKVVDHLKASLL
jgi:hypothetical protein